MRYTLKDYQADAVADVLHRLARAKDSYERHGALSQFSLAATTGAGKTVMAAAVIEALFFGSDEFDFAADPTASVLWFSDDPSLNEQSRARIHAASSELDARLRPIESTFGERVFAPGTVYFLNAQKLREGARLVRGATAPSDADAPALIAPAPDLMQRSLYDVIANTLAEGRTLYFLLDEAHRGMGTQRDRETIVQKLINGHAGAPPMPVVFGISATVERFTTAMQRVQNRDALPPVEVDAALVQASGLLKDDIVLTIPDERGSYDTTLLRDAVGRVRASTAAWAAYAAEQEESDPVVPLLVIQVTDKPTDEELTRILDVVHAEWPELRAENVAHVFGTHTDRTLPGQTIPYVAPQRVQDTRRIRVLLAMEAISTGWDCPRAEVLMSFRTRNDATYVQQLLGRMMRTPLARRIPGDEILNSVDCLLPHFDRETSTDIARMLMRGETSIGPGPFPPGPVRVLFDPVHLEPNPQIPDAVWKAFDALPTVTVPRTRTRTRPIKRLDRLATHLSKDGVIPGARAQATLAMCRVLDGRRAQYADQVGVQRREILEVSAARLRARMAGATITEESVVLDADGRAVEHAYADAGRALTEWLTSAYVDHLVPADGSDEDLAEAHLLIAALGRVADVVADVETEAQKLTQRWLDETRIARKGLSDERQAEYDAIQGMSSEPERITLSRPKRSQADRRWRTPDGQEHAFPLREHHLMAAPDGTVPVELNDWETRVLDTESREASFRGWYRNPARAAKESLAVAYRDGIGEWKALRPDFLFFHETDGGDVVADLVDPHGHHLSDALPKLRGLADFAEDQGSGFRRIESVAETDGVLKVLDLTDAAVREAVRTAEGAKALYTSAHAHVYTTA